MTQHGVADPVIIIDGFDPVEINSVYRLDQDVHFPGIGTLPYTIAIGLEIWRSQPIGDVIKYMQDIATAIMKKDRSENAADKIRMMRIKKYIAVSNTVLEDIARHFNRLPEYDKDSMMRGKSPFVKFATDVLEGTGYTHEKDGKDILRIKSMLLPSGALDTMVASTKDKYAISEIYDYVGRGVAAIDAGMGFRWAAEITLKQKQLPEKRKIDTLITDNVKEGNTLKVTGECNFRFLQNIVDSIYAAASQKKVGFIYDATDKIITLDATTIMMELLEKYGTEVASYRRRKDISISDGTTIN